jgi:hypothetical protein
VLRLGLGVIAVAMLTIALAGAGAASAEVTGASENLRTGWYPDEPSLAPSLVGSGQFEQVFNVPLQGQIYAQPLVANGTLLVVTEDDWAYGLDPVTGAVRWAKNYGEAVESLIPPISCEDLAPHVGITGTPVIDTEHNIAYFVANEFLNKEIVWRMHAINLATGSDVPNFPVKIEGEARNLPKGVKFDAAQQLQRPALLMMNGVVYAAFGSHCDKAPYAGWIVGVSSSGQLATMWATTGKGGPIWQSGGGLVSDGPGQILFSTGNQTEGGGSPTPGPGKAPPEGRLSESVVRAEVQPGGELRATDFFSPFNNEELDEFDLDLGSAAPVALPSPYFGTSSGPLLVQEGKYGTVYLLNRNELGGMGQGPGGKDKVVEEQGPYGGVWGAAAIWPGDGGYVYIPSFSAPKTPIESSNKLRFFKYGVEAGNPRLALAAATPEKLWFGSGSPIVTSTGTAHGTATVWITWCPTEGCHEAQLRAYDAVPNGSEPTPFWTGPIGFATKFSRPYAGAGHIYVANREGHIIAFAGPLTPSTRSLELGSTLVGAQLRGQVTFTNTGRKDLNVAAVHQPSGPFSAAGLPGVGSVIERGQTITVEVVFQSPSPGSFAGSLGFTTQAGEIQVSLSASAIAPPPESGAIATNASFVTGPGGPGAGPEAPPILRKLKIRASASRLAHGNRTLAISFQLSALGKVAFRVYRRVISHHCKRGVSRCVHWIGTKIKLKVRGHKGINVLTVNLGTLSAGEYRLAATPIARSGALGVTRYVYFKAVGQPRPAAR